VAGRWVDGACCLASLDSDQILELNEVGGRIWELACEGRRIGDIASALVSEFEVDEGTARRDVEELITRLVRDGLLLED
jgi:hypothetical protein